MRRILASAAVTLAACSTITPQQATTLSDAELCMRYGNVRSTIYAASGNPLRAEIDKRRIIRPEFRRAFEEAGVAVGMTAIEALCSWGGPNKVNSTATRSGEHHQWVYETYYGRTLGSEWRFVYVENGVVTAVQY